MDVKRIAILFDIDGTLVTTGGAGATSWRLAFDELYGIPADIGEFTDAGMTDPEVGRQTFESVSGSPNSVTGKAAPSDGYRVLPGVVELLPRLIGDGYLLGIVTGNVEAAAHIKLHRAGLNRFFSFGGYGSDSDDRAEITRIALRRAALVYGADLDAKQAIVVGDTPRDVDGAHGQGGGDPGRAARRLAGALPGCRGAPTRCAGSARPSSPRGIRVVPAGRGR